MSTDATPTSKGNQCAAADVFCLGRFRLRNRVRGPARRESVCGWRRELTLPRFLFLLPHLPLDAHLRFMQNGRHGFQENYFSITCALGLDACPPNSFEVRNDVNSTFLSFTSLDFTEN